LASGAGCEPGSFRGAVVHAAKVKAAAAIKKRRETGVRMVGDAADGVLFTNGRVGPLIPTLDPAPWRRPPSLAQGEHNLAKPNFGYQKRQKELEKKRKKEEKLKKRQERAAAAPVEGQPPAPETPEPV